jgi:hypothetical protein
VRRGEEERQMEIQDKKKYNISFYVLISIEQK